MVSLELKKKGLRHCRRLLTVVAITLSSCVQVPIVVPLSVPSRPVLPSILSGELECLSPPVYRRLLDRDVLQKTYIDRILQIIEAHNG